MNGAGDQRVFDLRAGLPESTKRLHASDVRGSYYVFFHVARA